MKRQDPTYIRPEPTTVLIDMDGVLANYSEEFERRWNREHPDKPLVTFTTRTNHNFDEEYPHFKKNIWAIQSQPDFYHTLPVIEGALEGLAALDEHYKGNVRICTAPSIHNTQCVPGKYHWIKQHLGKDWMRKVHFDKDKTLARGTYLIDDKPHITGVMKPEWQHIRYAQPYNRGTSPRITWKDVIANKGNLEAMLQSSQPSLSLCN